MFSPSPALSAALAYIAVMDEVAGWLSPAGAHALCLLHSAQARLGIRGDLAEIGVHHGKSALLLSCFVDPEEEWLYLNDVFEEQGANPSGSGSGDRKVFLANLERFRPGFRRYTIQQKPSQDLRAEDIGSRCRIFHIDGGHFADETEADLRTAARSLHPDGVIVVDDYFNENFPGVSEGVGRFLAANDGIRPFLLGFNKMYLCRTPNRSLYGESMLEKELTAGFRIGFSKSRFYGGEVLLLQELPRLIPVSLQIRLPAERLVCRPGEHRTLMVAVENRGTANITHEAGAEVSLDYHLSQAGKIVRFDNHRASLVPLPKGERRLVPYPLVVPSAPGEYLCEFDGVIENLTWLKDTGGETAFLELVVA